VDVPGGYYVSNHESIPVIGPCSRTEEDINLYYCPKGSANSPISVLPGYYLIGGDGNKTREEAVLSEPGTFSLNGVRHHCPAGTFGETHGLYNSSCTGLCPPGYYCEEGSPSPTKCPKGTFGESKGLTDMVCSGLCPPGYYCEEGSPVPTKCPKGTFGESNGLTDMACSGLCPPGYYCPEGTITPLDCDFVDVFCPQGSSFPRSVSPGHYTIGEHETRRYDQIQCPAGYFCVDGLKYPCEPGKFQSDLGSSSCEQNCSKGYYCDGASDSEFQHRCGDNSVFCIEGSYEPTIVQEGYYSSGGDVNTRSLEIVCSPGTFCKNGVTTPCPAGTFSSSEGSTSCELAPPGFYSEGAVSIPTPCEAGTYSHISGLSTCLLCVPGYYCDLQSVDPKQHECGSDYVYCEAGSSSPTPVSPGYYSIGGKVQTRTGQLPCDSSNSHARLCPRSAVLVENDDDTTSIDDATVSSWFQLFGQ